MVLANGSHRRPTSTGFPPNARTLDGNPNPTTMTPNEQRIAIARACGWKNFNSASHEGSIQYGQPPNAPHNSWELPNYLNDLNAIAEARKILNSDQQIQFSIKVGKFVTQTLRANQSAWMDFRLIDSSAGCQSEMFLRTLGLWQETSTPTQPQ